MSTNSKLAQSIAEKMAQPKQQDLATSQTPAVAGHGVELLPRAEIYVDEQVRKTYTESSLKELADSISEMGVLKGNKYEGLLQAISVGARDERGYPVIYGHRRFLAIDTHLKWDLVPVKQDQTVRDNLAVLGAVQLVENIQREDLHPIEVALGIASMREDGKKSGEIAKMLGKPNSYVSKHMKIASIPMDLLTELAKICQDVEALYSIGQLVKLDGIAAQKLVHQAVAAGKLGRADVTTVIDRVELAQRKEKLPSAAKIEQAIREYYLNAPQEALTLSALRETLNVIEDDHELFIALAAPILSEIVSVREEDEKARQTPPESVSETGEGKGTPSATDAPETAPESVTETGEGKGTAPVTDAPETAPESVSAAGEGKGTAPVTDAPKAAPKSVYETFKGPTVKVRWVTDGSELHGRLVLSTDDGLGIKPAEGMVVVETADGGVMTAPMEDLMISAVIYG
ncbi:ParB/RepB/Spo0J family partition protein [Aeromonas veronii]|nr:ParB/RepB/Spo0J family partition protein [Aeromonas veronii]